MKRQRVPKERCGVKNQEFERRKNSWTLANRQDGCLKPPLDGGAVLEAFQWDPEQV